MSILTLPASTSNVGAADPVRTDPAEFINGPFTDEKFEGWLNSHPDRRRSYEKDSPKEQE